MLERSILEVVTATGLGFDTQSWSGCSISYQLTQEFDAININQHLTQWIHVSLACVLNV